MNSATRICIVAASAAIPALASLPHAFSYGGKPFSAVSAEGRVVADDARLTKTVHEWTSPDGKLLLRSTETAYKNFPVKEYLPELVCLWDGPTDIVDGFRSVSLSRTASGAVLRALRGTVNTDKDFEPVTVAFGRAGATNSDALVATEGRSSAQRMPWMVVDFPEGDGVEIAVGWSGAWRADC